MENDTVFKLTDIHKLLTLEFEKTYNAEKEIVIKEIKKILKEKYNIIL